MHSSSIIKITQGEPNPAGTTSPLLTPSSTNPSEVEVDEQLARLHFRRLLAQYRRAGYEVAKRLQQTQLP